VIFDQAEFQIRCEWRWRGLHELAPACDVVILVDVLSFTTALDIAASRGAIVFPYRSQDASARVYAAGLDAHLACPNREAGFSLSPASLETLPAGYRLVLPSPNGAALAFAAHHPCVLAACLRNAAAVARAAAGRGTTFAVIPAGEIWDSGEFRPCLEDLIGAGAVVASLPGSRSPEAQLAAAAGEHFRADFAAALRKSSSGKELIARGFARDVELAAQSNVSPHVPALVGRAFVALSSPPSDETSSAPPPAAAR
jgi:2-phosphosulfolactate phosphatase